MRKKQNTLEKNAQLGGGGGGGWVGDVATKTDRVVSVIFFKQTIFKKTNKRTNE